MGVGNLWALTCLFNPLGVRSRKANFRAFRARLGVPLVAVELSFDGNFELEPQDADILVRVAGGDVMWQKERLLNLGRDHLPRTCDAVAVVDCDIVFADRAWPAAALAQLQLAPMVQLFSDAHYLPRDAELDAPGEARALRSQLSSARAIRDGKAPSACFARSVGVPRGAYSPGLAWAFRRTLLDRHGLFDRCIVGGGDTAAACAAWGAFTAVEDKHEMNGAQRAHYRAWAQPWYDDVRGNVGALGGSVLHLWHGDLLDRRSTLRHAGLAAHAFDPERDLALHESGSWRWASEKPALHQYVAEYFASRREDG